MPMTIWIWKRVKIFFPFPLTFNSWALHVADKFSLPVCLEQQERKLISQQREEHFQRQVWAGKAEPAEELLQWPEDFTRSPWEHRALAGPARPVWYTGWSAGVVLEAQSGFIKSADVAVMDPPGWVLSWSLVWLAWISYGNCMSCACLVCGLGQMNK